jgi:3-deoxy-manno-octulosonate cytidylyltransferase (CMP-KDO synthetase)
MSSIGIIPARFASTRFPGKPLALIQGKPMIQWVYEGASKAELLSTVVVATDHPSIFEAVNSFGGFAVMTREDHPSGTDRCYEALCLLNQSFDYVINIQGDEPMIDPGMIDQLCTMLIQGKPSVVTLARKISDPTEIENPNVVKVVFDASGRAMYFSRSPIPYQRNIPRSEWVHHQDYFKHLGIYGFRSEILKNIVALSTARLEIAESLEQLRWMVHGIDVHVASTDYESISVDTPEDIHKLINNF